MPSKKSKGEVPAVSEDTTTQLIKGIKALEKQVKSDAANVGLVVDIRDRLYDESMDTKVRLAAFHALRRIFCSFLELGLLTKDKLDKSAKTNKRRKTPLDLAKKLLAPRRQQHIFLHLVIVIN